MGLEGLRIVRMLGKERDRLRVPVFKVMRINMLTIKSGSVILAFYMGEMGAASPRIACYP